MGMQTVKIGIVGLGANTRLRHVPGFRAIRGVKIVGVVNSTPESTARVAAEFEIPRTYSDWQTLVADPDLDAVMIGTWPNRHCEITCAALESGKHVLTEARMARTASEARRMWETAKRHPKLAAQIVPSPFGLAENQFVLDLIADGFLGELRDLVIIGADDSFYDASKPLHWRQDKSISGMNILAMGILHETAMRWTPRPTRVFAQTTLFEKTRPAEGWRGVSGSVAPSSTKRGHEDLGPATRSLEATVPDSVQILTELEGGARGLYHLSGITLFGPGRQIHLYGSRGTIKLELAAETKLAIGQSGDAALRTVEIPPEKRGGWRVEAEFIGAIRGEEEIRFTNFETGVAYMEFTEAVTKSGESGQPVNLPLLPFH